MIFACFKQNDLFSRPYLWAGSVGYGRMYQGDHCFHDVGVGALIGIGSAFLSYKQNSWMRGKWKN